MKNISTGTGLVALALAIVGYPILDRLLPAERGAHAGVAAPAAVAKAALGQAEPTIVWYGATQYVYFTFVMRAWSDGRMEMRRIYNQNLGGCNPQPDCVGPWVLVSDPAEGYAASADINGDQHVDGADLGLVLGFWGEAPRHDIPPSNCPLNLVNP